MNVKFQNIVYMLCFVTFFVSTGVFSAQDGNVGQNKVSIKEKPSFEDKDIMLRFVSFTPQQIGSFYEGREFSRQAIKKLMESCYVTVIVKNKTNDILWLDLDKWVFKQQGKIFQRQTRDYWKKQWEAIDLPQSHRSTFGWTLMPVVRNLYPNEGVGGRIPIPMQTMPFNLTLNFPTGENRRGKVKSITMKDLICKQDGPKT